MKKKLLPILLSASIIGTTVHATTNLQNLLSEYNSSGISYSGAISDQERIKEDKKKMKPLIEGLCEKIKKLKKYDHTKPKFYHTDYDINFEDKFEKEVFRTVLSNFGKNEKDELEEHISLYFNSSPHIEIGCISTELIDGKIKKVKDIKIDEDLERMGLGYLIKVHNHYKN